MQVGTLNFLSPRPWILTHGSHTLERHKPQATSHKPQATSHKPQATSHKPQTTSHKPQATNEQKPSIRNPQNFAGLRGALSGRHLVSRAAPRLCGVGLIPWMDAWTSPTSGAPRSDFSILAACVSAPLIQQQWPGKAGLVFVCLRVYVYVRVRLSVCPHVRLSVRLSVSLSVSVHIRVRKADCFLHHDLSDLI